MEIHLLFLHLKETMVELQILEIAVPVEAEVVVHLQLELME
tara:strand:+ start:121 stop:243 length:123 start_codon:yes stop_codon:yes gene_type:complete